jgi:NADPH:quinone reductase-like Zn-dependent oxidoreductase
MRAVYFTTHGGPEVLVVGERPQPAPRADQVLIEVHAAGVNPRDWMLRQGTYFAGRLAGALPIIPGSDVSGRVVAVGSQVDVFGAGDEVVAMQSTLGRMGGYAQYVAIKASCVAHRPAGVSHVQGAALPVAGLTAWQALYDHARVGVGSKVTIVGAAGGVGHYATQLARWSGAEVTAVCGPANLDFVREIGAERVIDYRCSDYTELVRDQDLVFDTIGRTPVAAARATLGRRGLHLTTVPNPPVMAATVIGRLWAGRRVAPVIVRPRQPDLTSLLQLMAAGDLRSEISGVYPLADAAEAQRASRSFHTRGKLVLSVRD